MYAGSPAGRVNQSFTASSTTASAAARRPAKPKVSKSSPCSLSHGAPRVIASPAANSRRRRGRQQAPAGRPVAVPEHLHEKIIVPGDVNMALYQAHVRRIAGNVPADPDRQRCRAAVKQSTGPRPREHARRGGIPCAGQVQTHAGINLNLIRIIAEGHARQNQRRADVGLPTAGPGDAQMIAEAGGRSLRIDHPCAPVYRMPAETVDPPSADQTRVEASVAGLVEGHLHRRHPALCSAHRQRPHRGPCSCIGQRRRGRTPVLDTAVRARRFANHVSLSGDTTTGSAGSAASTGSSSPSSMAGMNIPAGADGARSVAYVNCTASVSVPPVPLRTAPSGLPVSSLGGVQGLRRRPGSARRSASRRESNAIRCVWGSTGGGGGGASVESRVSVEWRLQARSGNGRPDSGAGNSGTPPAPGCWPSRCMPRKKPRQGRLNHRLRTLRYPS